LAKLQSGKGKRAKHPKIPKPGSMIICMVKEAPAAAQEQDTGELHGDELENCAISLLNVKSSESYERVQTEAALLVDELRFIPLLQIDEVDLINSTKQQVTKLLAPTPVKGRNGDAFGTTPVEKGDDPFASDFSTPTAINAGLLSTLPTESAVMKDAQIIGSTDMLLRAAAQFNRRERETPPSLDKMSPSIFTREMRGNLCFESPLRSDLCFQSPPELSPGTASQRPSLGSSGGGSSAFSLFSIPGSPPVSVYQNASKWLITSSCDVDYHEHENPLWSPLA
jgi:hypothetical protein